VTWNPWCWNSFSNSHMSPSLERDEPNFETDPRVRKLLGFPPLPMHSTGHDGISLNQCCLISVDAYGAISVMIGDKMRRHGVLFAIGHSQTGSAELNLRPRGYRRLDHFMRRPRCFIGGTRAPTNEGAERTKIS
jgi:hypothetical protein